jgi:hypothetical protein
MFRSPVDLDRLIGICESLRVEVDLARLSECRDPQTCRQRSPVVPVHRPTGDAAADVALLAMWCAVRELALDWLTVQDVGRSTLLHLRVCPLSGIESTTGICTIPARQCRPVSTR